MGRDIRMICILVCSPFLIAAVHAAWSRIDRSGLPQTVAARSIILGYLPAAIILWEAVFASAPFTADSALAAFYCFVVYSSFSYAYFHLFNMSETARRIRIINEIHRAGAMRYEQLTAMYRSRDIIELRLNRLVAMKELRLHDGCYAMNGRLLYLAALFISRWRRLIGFSEMRETRTGGRPQ